ncbi:acyltransferase [Aquitalea pelogenes]|uniref:acyltransferase n=1 Tax=Aquitalea pelogenes TaxID=1293573 RepID=UPI0035B400DA
MAIVGRNYKIDSLRIAASFAVVMLHTAAGYLVKLHSSDSMAWWVANFFDASCRWSVPVFILISGSLLLRSEEPIFTFFRKRFFRICIPLIFWSVLYLCIRVFIFKNIKINDIPVVLMAGAPYVHLWYLYMLIGLYLVFPILRKFVKSVNKAFGVCFVVFLSLLSVANLFLDWIPDFFLVKFVPFLCYFLGGYFLGDVQLSVKGLRLAFLLVVLIFLTALSAGWAIHFYGIKGLWVAYDYLSPLVIIVSFLIFSLPVQEFPSFPTDVSLSESSFGIYLIHPLFLIPLGFMFSISNALYLFVLIPVMSFFVFFASWKVVVLVRRFPFGRGVFGG